MMACKILHIPTNAFYIATVFRSTGVRPFFSLGAASSFEENVDAYITLDNIIECGSIFISANYLRDPETTEYTVSTENEFLIIETDK